MRNIVIAELNPQTKPVEPRGMRTRGAPTPSMKIIAEFSSEFSEPRQVPAGAVEARLIPGRKVPGTCTLLLPFPDPGRPGAGGHDGTELVITNLCTGCQLVLKVGTRDTAVIVPIPDPERPWNKLGSIAGGDLIMINGPGHARVIGWDGSWRLTGGFNVELKTESVPTTAGATR